jgi:CubicO group peptidase (beta-lactamase class C family)
MCKTIISLSIISTLIICSCSNHDSKIIGYWEATFSDPVNNPIQYIEFKTDQNRLSIAIDEPDEDWYDIPGERIFFKDDSLYFERFWGLEKYYGRFDSLLSAFSGTKELIGKPLITFSLKRISYDKLAFKLPGKDNSGNPILQYQYAKPIQEDSLIKCTDLTEAGIDSVPLKKLIDKILRREIPNIHSILIAINNKLVLEEYFYNYSKEKPHRIHSVTKSFTSALTGIVLDKRLIQDVNVPVWKYFISWDSSKWVENKYDIQIQHLLSMSAGLDWKGLTLNESNDDIDMYKTRDYFSYLLNKDIKYPSGTNFCYNNGLSLMLGHIIKEVAGLAVDSFAKINLFEELEISKYSWDCDDNGITRTDGGLKMRPRDMLKLGLLYLNSGSWNGKQLISDNWTKISTYQKIDLDDRGYSYHWWTKDYILNNTLIRTYFALGFGEQAVIVVPDYNLVFGMTAGNFNQPEHRPFEIMADYILPSLGIGENTEQKQLINFTGEYQINQTESINIELIDSILYVIDPAGVTFKLKPESPFCYTVEDQPREVRFIMDKNGMIIYGEIFVNGQKVERLKKIK